MDKIIFVSFVSTAVIFASETLPSSSHYALSSLAPKGHWALQLEGKNRTTDASYDNRHSKSGLGSAYDNIELDQNVFPMLSVFGEGASLGKTSSTMDIDAQQYEFTIGYGISDDLTIGAIIPYRKKTIHMKFSVAGANLGVNPIFDDSSPVSATNTPYLPISVEGIAPINTQQIQNVLSSQALDFGYKPLQTTTTSGFADPTLGVLYRVYNKNNASIILGAGYRFGIAKEDDSNNLLETDIGDGNSGIRLQVEYFSDMSHGFDFYSKIEYGIELEDRVDKRVPEKGAFLASLSSTEKLTRDLGDYRIYDLEVGKSWRDFRACVAWHRSEKDSDHYSSSKGTDVSTLETNTYAYTNQWEGSLSWSGLDAWKKGDLPFPLIVNLTYRDTYKAKNALDWSEVHLTLTSFF